MKEAEKLLQKYINKAADSLEQSIIEEWYAKLDVRNGSGFTEQQQREQLERIRQNLPGHPALVIRLRTRILTGIAAAVALIVAGIYILNYRSDETEKQQQKLSNDVRPGTSGATLILGNGKKIRLSEAKNGALAKEAGVVILKSANGQLIYQMNGSAVKQANINTLSTANGETFQLNLPDGSRVYLNAASSLTYHASLNDNGLRRVKLTGEGYFEIAKDKAHPFIVETERQVVKVLGTRFNINSYVEEPVTTTTLFEGAIQLNHETLLVPGEQAVVSSSGKISVGKTDVENAIAWKNGYFQFDGENLEVIMRKVARWYNVKVKYQDDKLKNIAFVGTVSRYKNVSQVLKTLQLTSELEFKIDRDIIIISSTTK